MDAETIVSNIELYQLQLSQIGDAIANENSVSEKGKLQQLQCDLVQLLELTLQQLASQENGVAVTSTDLSSVQLSGNKNAKSIEEQKMDEEFALFQSEMSDLLGNDDSVSNTDNSSDVNLTHSIKNLEALEGTHCQAPYTERWGGHSYHNAVVLSLILDSSGTPNLVEPKVLVLFLHPTNASMLTCPFFMDGKCHFTESSCRFSHGHEVFVSQLKDYLKPDISSVVAGSRVLAAYKDQLWRMATVEDVLEDHSSFSVKFDGKNKVVEVRPENLILVNADEAASPTEASADVSSEELSLQSTATEETNDSTNSVAFIPTSVWLSNGVSQRLGEWEKHTNGIGSKLMQNMGYIVGTGLGPKGDGRVEPVEAYLYPPGVSLDRCMELKELSNGEVLLKVEKRLEKQRRKEEERQERYEERQKERTSVFDIINNKLGAQISSDETQDEKLGVCSHVLRKDSSKELNMKNYKLSEKISQLEKEICKMSQSKKRQSGDNLIMKSINATLFKKQKELSHLREAEKKVQSEQQNRNFKRKFCTF